MFWLHSSLICSVQSTLLPFQYFLYFLRIPMGEVNHCVICIQVHVQYMMKFSMFLYFFCRPFSPTSTSSPPDVISMIGVPRPSPFFVLFCLRMLHWTQTREWKQRRPGNMATRLQSWSSFGVLSKRLPYNLLMVLVPTLPFCQNRCRLKPFLIRKRTESSMHTV